MTATLPKGGNVPLPAAPLRVTTTATAGPDLDVTALLLNDAGKVRNDDDMVFYNQPKHPRSAVTFVDGAVNVDPARLEPEVARIAIAVSADGATFDRIKGLRVRVLAGAEVAVFEPGGLTTEKALVLGELYRRGAGWKFRAVGQGWDSGLAALATAFGVAVDEPGPAVPPVPDAPARTPPKPPSAPSAAPKPPAPTAPVHSAAPMSINMTKGSAPIRLTKTALITATASWASETDYDLYALVVTRDGALQYVARFGAVDLNGRRVQPMSTFRGVAQDGDAGRSHARSGVASETLTIRFDDTIAAVIPIAYSAQSNGTGSFNRYRVSLAVDNGAGQRVTVDSANASKNDRRYTCVPAIILNGTDGTVTVEHVERYSKVSSEYRPSAKLKADGTVQLLMDKGPLNEFK